MIKAANSLAVSSFSDKEFVQHVYSAVLDRPADPDGLAAYMDRLEEGWTRGRLVDVIRNSEEAAKRWTASWTQVKSIVQLLFGEGATDLIGLFEHRLETVSLESLWTIAERIVTDRPDHLSGDEIDLLFDDVAGWLEVPSNNVVSGYILGPSRASRIELRLNGEIAGAPAHTRPHDLLNAAGVPASLFTIRIDESKLSDFAINFLTATVDGKSLLPRERAFSPWVTRFAPAFQRFGLGRFNLNPAVPILRADENGARSRA